MDIDPRNGGAESLAKLVAEHGPLPLTPKVKTGGGGYHYWLRYPPGTPCGKPFAGIDRKAEGGYVILPPSKIDIPEHQGRAYTWVDGFRPWEVGMAVAPGWLLSTKPPPKPKASAEAPADDPWIVRPSNFDLLTHPGSPEGERRRVCCQLVGVHLARGDSPASVAAMALAWAERCQPPLEEWRKHVDGLIRKEKANGLKMTTPYSPPSSLAVLLSPEASKEVTNSEPDRQSEAEAVSTAQAQADPVSPSQASPSTDAEGELITYFPPSAGNERGEEEGLSSSWPTLPPEAYHGLLGEMLRAVSLHTEADPAGILLGWLTCFGSCIGKGAWTYACGNHHPALFLALVGLTSARKGVAYGIAEWPFAKADPEWMKLAVCNGVGSGQGLIERVRDESRTMKLNKKTGMAEEQVIPGAADKRCLLRLDELAVCFKLQRSENSTLGETLMTAWGGSVLEVPNRSGNDLRASDYSIAVIGDTQPETIRKLLEKGIEQHNGWLNRFLWCAVKRVRNIPRPAKLDALLTPFLERLASALAFAKQAGELAMDGEAEALWDGVYGVLSLSADSVPHTNRAEPYVMRLALLYALADSSKVIGREHLQAALALWSYCRASAALIFGGKAKAEAKADPLWLQVLNAIGQAPGVKRGELTMAFKNRLKAEALDEALAYLGRNGLAYKRTVQPEGGGRPAEHWYPGPKPDGDGDGESVADDNPSLPPTSEQKGIAESYTLTGEPKGITNCYTLAPLPDASAIAFVGNASKEVINSPLDTTCRNSPTPKPSGLGVATADGGRREATAELVTYFPPSQAAGDSVAGFPATDGKAAGEEKVVIHKAHAEAKHQAWLVEFHKAQALREAERLKHIAEDEPMSDADFIAGLNAIK